MDHLIPYIQEHKWYTFTQFHSLITFLLFHPRINFFRDANYEKEMDIRLMKSDYFPTNFPIKTDN